MTRKMLRIFRVSGYTHRFARVKGISASANS